MEEDPSGRTEVYLRTGGPPSGGSEEEAELPSLSRGETFGPFRILARIGEGGMGSVYLAEQRPMFRIVALKILRDGSRDLTALRRFQDEIRFMARLRSEHVAQVYGSGWSGGVPWCEMEFVEGSSLRAIVRRCPVESERISRLLLGIVRGLAAIHRAGIVHGDVKPDNVVLRLGTDGDEAPVLVDFGLAHWETQRVAGTEGRLCGTPLYMAPECWEPAGTPPDHRSDLYSLGATLYQLLTGQAHLSPESPVEFLARAKHRAFPAPSSRNPDVCPVLDRICMKLLAPDPGERYASAEEVEEELVERTRRQRCATVLRRVRADVRRERRILVVRVLVAILLATAIGWCLGLQTSRALPPPVGSVGGVGGGGQDEDP